MRISIILSDKPLDEQSQFGPIAELDDMSTSPHPTDSEETPLPFREILRSPSVKENKLYEARDGLNRFSYLELSNFWRVQWTKCHGVFDAKNDCLARKGFSFGETVVADGLSIDVYNLHANPAFSNHPELGRLSDHTAKAGTVLVGGSRRRSPNPHCIRRPTPPCATIL